MQLHFSMLRQGGQRGAPASTHCQNEQGRDNCIRCRSDGDEFVSYLWGREGVRDEVAFAKTVKAWLNRSKTDIST
jgi:hypothetical protein